MLLFQIISHLTSHTSHLTSTHHFNVHFVFRIFLDESLFQGDILLDPDEDERGQNTFASIKGGRWPGAKIPYVIDSSIESKGRNAISAAINDYHKYTCLRFSPRRSEGAYLKFYRGGG